MDAYKTWLIDTVERAGFTFLETFAAAFGLAGLYGLVNGQWQDVLSAAHNAELAGIAAAIAVVKAAVAGLRARTLSPASLAKLR